MQDHTYRMGIAWQNCGYNQPPHLGFYLPDMFDRDFGVFSDAYATGVRSVSAAKDRPADNKVYNLNGQFVGVDADNVAKGVYVVGGKKVVVK